MVNKCKRSSTALLDKYHGVHTHKRFPTSALLPPPSPSAHICTMRWLFWDNQWVVKSLRGRLDEENKMRDRMKFLLSHDSFLGLSLWWGFCFCRAGGPAAPFFLVSHPREGPKEAKSGIICFWLIAPWTVRFYTQGLPPPFFFYIV